MDNDCSARGTASSLSTVSRRQSLSSASSTADQDTSLPVGAPISNFFEVRHTQRSGRAVFARQSIPKDTLVWRSDDLALSVLLREYRREVCGQCFRYENGRDLEIRDKTVGFAFCCVTCQKEWREANGTVGVQAWMAVEKLVKGRSKEDSEMVDIDQPRPKAIEITNAWDGVAAQATLIRAAREAEQTTARDQAGPLQVTKQHKKALQKALQQPISPDIMSFCVSGIIWRHQNPEDWGKVLALAEDNTPYHNTDDLQAFARTYLHLLVVLPLRLLPLVTAESIFLVSSRDSHNAFGIRSLGDDGSEFFGFGCWPAASYFNHSCGPNIEKRRVGRAWEFRAGAAVHMGDELCITYLSGEERKLSREKRMLTLKKNWGFECRCARCEAL